ncbi:bifunctional diguanylate cyclase/phosphodiesterase [Actinomycetes bacterium KLBMP 9797]
MSQASVDRMAEALAAALAAEPFDPAPAYRVAADLVASGCQTPEALGRTLAAVHSGLSGPRLPQLVEALATGFARALRDHTLDAQDELRHAALAARIRAEAALRESETRFRYAALHDPLTALPNRTYFTRALEHACADRRPGSRLGVCVLGLDHFQAVNDSLGHPAGDRLLAEVSDRLAILAADPNRLVARIGGDEFAILVEETTCTDDAVKVADKALALLTEPVEVDGHALRVTASVGVVERPVTDADPADLLRAADITLHWAKADRRGGWAVFDPARNATDVARYRLSAEMPAALERGEIVPHYQPLVDLTDGTVVGAEALARWRHPRLGPLEAGRFIGLAERTGLITRLGQRLLERACRDAAGWPDATFVSVNLAVAQIRHPGLAAQVATVLDVTGLPPARLQLEITESAVMAIDDDTIATLRALADLGVQLAIDDFGTGYSNLAYLCDLPVHALKLAGRFLQSRRPRGEVDPTREVLLHTLVTMGHKLGLSVTAEGVETAAQARRLRGIGCDLGQGWHFGHPQPSFP